MPMSGGKSKMKRVLCVVPAAHDVGLTSVSLGLLQAFKEKGHAVGFLKPITQGHAHDPEHELSTSLVRRIFDISVPVPISLKEGERLMGQGQGDVLMEHVVELMQKVDEKAQVVIVELLASSRNLFYAKLLNSMIVRALDGDVVLAAAPNGKTPEELAESIEIESRDFRSTGNLAGVVINKIGRSKSTKDYSKNVLPHAKARYFGRIQEPTVSRSVLETFRKAVEENEIRVVGTLPWQQKLVAPKLSDFAASIEAHAVRHGDIKRRRVRSVAFCTMTVSKAVYYMQDDTLVITTGDRSDILLAASMASLNGVRLAGILLCGGFEPDPNILILCEKAFSKGLPMISVGCDLFTTANIIADVPIQVSLEDVERSIESMKIQASNIDPKWIADLMLSAREHRMSPPEFRSKLIRLAKRRTKRIVLPEGTEPRTLQAAAICAERGIAIPVLLAKEADVRAACAKLELELPPQVEILDPDTIWSRYQGPLVEMRKHKGMTDAKAEKTLRSDPIYVGTMMLKLGEVDGLVSGALHTTAATVRPAMQVIKPAPWTNLISSVFFMCLPDQILIYGDCAVNQTPSSEELAQIAIQSADTAATFQIPVRVAMISYSTGESGEGEDVEKVRKATEIVQQQRPDILIDGPLQYDAAMIASVAKSKAPKSKVAGRATILIFPDLNTGNTTYKAVQRSANVVSIGPMLQGLAKPVNDLSRGCLVEDIVYTIALTSIQAQQVEEFEKANALAAASPAVPGSIAPHGGGSAAAGVSAASSAVSAGTVAGEGGSI